MVLSSGKGIVVVATTCFALGVALGLLIRPQGKQALADVSVIRNVRKTVQQQEAKVCRQKEPPVTKTPQEVVKESAGELTSPLIDRLDDGTLVLNLGGQDPAEVARHLKDLRKRNPDLFNAVSHVLKTHIEKNARALSDRIAKIESFPIEAMSSEEQENHQRVIAFAKQMANLHAAVNSRVDPVLTQAETDALRLTSDQLSQEFEYALRQERNALFRMLAGELGLAGQDAEDVVWAMEIITEATTPKPEVDEPSVISSVVLKPSQPE